jgi:hypothetical protein
MQDQRTNAGKDSHFTYYKLPIKDEKLRKARTKYKTELSRQLTASPAYCKCTNSRAGSKWFLTLGKAIPSGVECITPRPPPTVAGSVVNRDTPSTQSSASNVRGRIIPESSIEWEWPSPRSEAISNWRNSNSPAWQPTVQDQPDLSSFFGANLYPPTVSDIGREWSILPHEPLPQLMGSQSPPPPNPASSQPMICIQTTYSLWPATSRRDRNDRRLNSSISPQMPLPDLRSCEPSKTEAYDNSYGAFLLRR